MSGEVAQEIDGVSGFAVSIKSSTLRYATRHGGIDIISPLDLLWARAESADRMDLTLVENPMVVFGPFVSPYFRLIFFSFFFRD